MATVALTESMLVLIYAVAMGLSAGAMAIVARRIGEKDADGAARAAVQAILLGVLIAVPVGLFGVAYAPAIAAVDGRLAGVVANASFTTVDARRQRRDHAAVSHQRGVPGAGDAAIAMRVLWIANAINICLDPCLIFGLGPFPRARHHRRGGGDHDRPRHRRPRPAVRAGAAARPGDDPARAPPDWIPR